MYVNDDEKHNIKFYDINNKLLLPNKTLKQCKINSINSIIYVNVYRVKINICFSDDKIYKKGEIEIDIDDIIYETFIYKVINQFELDKNNINIKQLKMMSDSLEITKDTFNEYLNDNHHKMLVINISKIPNTPTIDKISIDNNNGIQCQTTTMNTDPIHYEYKYELKNMETNQIKTGSIKRINEMLVIKETQSDKRYYYMRIRIFNQVIHSQWSSWQYKSHSIPVIDNIKCDAITQTECTIQWQAGLNEYDLKQDMRYKLYMKIKNVNEEMDEKEREELDSKLIVFDKNNKDYKYQMNGLK
eukprot:203207_1